ncbi:ubiquinol-cytochrome C chaperone family protein [Qipengyuania sp. MTN3-11]|uniref:ubiquinol-cytochrome C chaperone family protein n=1 Tax=Qipengyuania sp. MTN3-11 TaxID=3056557 RepID=UPI0036F1D5DA
MNLLSRLIRSRRDPRETVRPLWHRTVAIAREPEWYTTCGVADTLEGRFDMVTAATALVLLRMEADPELAELTGPYTEFFVEDMDGQLRQAGVGDLVVGKKIGKLMGTLGGRIGAYRDGLQGGREALAAAARRNVTMADENLADALAVRIEQLRDRLANISANDLVRGAIA